MIKRDSSSTMSNDDLPRIKRMRKGTKSCIACRRRKIKCLYSDSRPGVCNDCHARGVPCIDQEHAELIPTQPEPAASSSATLKARVSQLEDMVRSLVGRTDSDKELSVGPMPSMASPPPQQDKTVLGSAPVLSLFNNSIVSAVGGWDDEPTNAVSHDNPESGEAPTRNLELTRSLLAQLPSRQTVSAIATEYGDWWTQWTRYFEGLFDAKGTSLDRYLENTFNADSPLPVARAMLCLSMSLEQMPLNQDLTRFNLTMRPDELADFYARTVYRRVLCDEVTGGTLEGIECLIIWIKYNINAGRPRKAWLGIRRAIAYAQMLNLHRKTARSVPTGNFSARRKELLWIELCTVDKVLSLILGQVYAVPLNRGDVDLINDGLALPSQFILRMANLCGRVIDRDQDIGPDMLNDEQALKTTLEIERELDTFERDWPLKLHEALPGENGDATTTEIMLHQIRILLHLPYFLRSYTDPRFRRHRTKAVDAARDLVRKYNKHRTEHGAEAVCRIVDFQVFTSAMLLVLNLVASGGNETGSPSSLADWKSVEVTVEHLKDTKETLGGKVAEQSVRVLELFLKCTDKQNQADCSGETAKIFVPYFGTLALKAGCHFDKSKATERSMATGLPTPPSGSHSIISTPSYDAKRLETPSETSYQQWVAFDSFNNGASLELGSYNVPGNQARNNPVTTPSSALASSFNEPLSLDLGSGTSNSMSGEWEPWNAFPNYFNVDLDQSWNFYVSGNNGISPAIQGNGDVAGAQWSTSLYK